MTRIPAPLASALSLAITGAHGLPDEMLRSELLDTFRVWVRDLEPLHAEQEIQDIIRRDWGTVIEPFTLTEHDVEIATILAMAAFSKASTAQRIRIVSRETLGREGGLVITRNLGAFYAERFALAEQRRNPKAGWLWAPRLAPRSDTQEAAAWHRTEATLSVGDRGYVVQVSFTRPLNGGYNAPSQLDANSRFSGQSRAPSALGLRFEVDDQAVRLLTGNPEAMIRFAALCEEEAVLEIRGGDGLSVPRTFVRLASLTGPDRPLKAIATADIEPTPWITCEPIEPPQLAHRHIVAISRWLLPVAAWVDQLWDEVA